MAFRDLFSFLFQRSSAEERVAAYVIREHDRGRNLAEILEDRYVQNRLGPQQIARLLDRPEVIKAIGNDTIARRPPGDRGLELHTHAARSGLLDDRDADRHIPGCEPVRLEDDDVRVRLAAGQLAGDDLLQLVHLQPVEHAALDRLDQVRRLEPRLLA